MSEIAFHSATRRAAMVRRGQVGCLELLDHFVARMERLNPQLNAVVVRDIDRARKAARRLDRRRQDPVGPLHGVPMTVKESFDLAGLPTTWGLTERRNHAADADPDLALLTHRRTTKLPAVWRTSQPSRASSGTSSAAAGEPRQK